MPVPVQVLFLIDLLARFGILLIIALSLNLEFGYTGIPNFGKLLAVAGGAFAVGFIPGRMACWLFGIGAGLDYSRLSHSIVTDINRVLANNPATALALFFFTLVIAGIVGAGLGFISCYPAIRLREEYLAITLLVMGEAIRIIGLNYPPIVGGTLGVMVPDPFRWAGELRYVVSCLVIVGIALLVFFYLEVLVRTPLGRMLRAIRDNEDVAKSLGKDVTRARMKAIMISAAIAAIGGALYAFHTSNVFSGTYDRGTWTFWPWVMVVLGGAANNIGVLLGAFGIEFLRKLVLFYRDQLAALSLDIPLAFPFFRFRFPFAVPYPYPVSTLRFSIPFDPVWLSPLMFGVALILIQMFRPEGVLREKPTSTLGYEKLKKKFSLRKAVSSSEREDSTSGRGD